MVVKIKKKLIHFDPDARVFDLSNGHKIQLCDKFSLVIIICLTLSFPENGFYENG